MPRTKELRVIRSREKESSSLERRITAAGASDLFGAVLEPPSACESALTTSTVEYMGFNNESFINNMRGIGESGGELIIASDNGLDRFTKTATTTYGPLVHQGTITNVVGSGSGFEQAVAVATSNSGIIWWGEEDGKIYRWSGSSAIHIATITPFASSFPVLIEYSLHAYSTTGDLDNAATIRLLALGTDVAGLYELDPLPGSPVTHSASNVTGGSTAQSFGMSVNNCGGIFHGEAGSSPNAITYRSQSALNTAVSTGISASQIQSQGLIPSALNNGCHAKLGFSTQASNVRYDGSSFSSANSFTGWGLNTGSVGGTGGDWVNVLSNTGEVLRINETQ